MPYFELCAPLFYVTLARSAQQKTASMRQRQRNSFFSGRKKTKADSNRKLISLAFLIAIPTCFVIASLFLFTLLVLLQRGETPTQGWLLFLGGVTATVGILSLAKLNYLRTFIHEAKHGIVVLFSGNKLSDMEVKEQTGQVEYALYEDRDHYEPFIVLAPYFLPLFSFPTWVAAMILGSENFPGLLFVLGLTLTLDLATAWFELYPNQSDLKRIRGGFFFASLFIAGANFLWLMNCLLFVQGGRTAYVEAFVILSTIIGRFI